MEDMKLEKQEKFVLLKNLLTELFTNEQQDILSCLVENEIESNVDYINDLKGKEKEYWKGHILKLKDIHTILKPININ